MQLQISTAYSLQGLISNNTRKELLGKATRIVPRLDSLHRDGLRDHIYAIAMSKPSSPLSNLPPEILVQVARFCTVPTILVLSQVCLSVRTAVLDSSVFRDKLQDPKGQAVRDLGSWIDAVAKRADGDPMAWARFALAHERSKALPQADTLSRCGAMADALLWIPALSVTKRALFSITSISPFERS